MGWLLRLSDKTVRKFAALPIYCQRQKCSPGNVVSGSIRFMQIFAGDRWRGGVKWELGRLKWRFSLYADIRRGSLERGRQMRVGSFKMAIFASFVHCLPIILHTWPHDSFQVIWLSMTLGIFQGHWTVSHQISQKRCNTAQVTKGY